MLQLDITGFMITLLVLTMIGFWLGHWCGRLSMRDKFLELRNEADRLLREHQVLASKYLALSDEAKQAYMRGDKL